VASPTDHPSLFAERLISGTIALTWVLWFVGGLYFAGPLLGWALAGFACWRLYLGDRSVARPDAIAWLWIGGMIVMLLALAAGHVANDLGFAQTMKSIAGWAKGWALFALFPFVGSVLPIRRTVIVRAIGRLGVQTLILLPLFVAAPLIGLPQTLYVSPLAALGGSGNEYFATVLYTFEPGTSAARWQFFAPWSPAIGFVAVFHALIMGEERHIGWKITGLTAALAMALLSQSRLALVALLLAWPVAWLISKRNQPATWLVAAPLALISGFFATAMSVFIDRHTADFAGARAASSRVRATLGRIALERWRGEAPWFGHGIVERGPHLVEYMPIGSHHSWFGLLFVKGMIGAAALAVPLFGALAISAYRAADSRNARRSFALLFVMLLYTFGENLEVLGYLIWPGLILIGMSHREDGDSDGGEARA